MKFKIYAGLGGGFGEVEYMRTVIVKTLAEAEDIAYLEAIEIYQSYGGNHGLLSYDEFIEENPDATDEEWNQAEQDDMESWIEYRADEVGC